VYTFPALINLILKGFSRPTQGSIPQISELAAIHVAKVFSGSSILPPLEERRRIAEADKVDWEKFFRYSSGRVTGLVDGLLYQQDLCASMGNPFSILGVLRTFGLNVWFSFLFSPCSLHTFLGSIPELSEVFIESMARIRTKPLIYVNQIVANCLFATFDILSYQIGRYENFFMEVFDRRTRSMVPPQYLYTESRFEVWWLTRLWDALTIFLIGLLLVGKWVWVKSIVRRYVIMMGSVFVLTYVLLRISSFQSLLKAKKKTKKMKQS
jgi:cytochrome c biogenesis protein CcdA